MAPRRPCGIHAMAYCISLLIAVQLPAAWSQQCPNPETQSVTSASMMQRGHTRTSVKANLKEELTGELQGGAPMSAAASKSSTRDAAADARFLIQGTFGPTRSSMAELSGMTYEQWVQKEMNLPVGSHRAYYRERVNPAYNSDVQYAAELGAPCAKGSRWHSFTFTLRDVGEPITVQSTNAILIGGVMRTELKQPPMASNWIALAGFAGFVCHVVEEIGEPVWVSTTQDCTNYQVMPNPAIWMSTAVPDFDAYIVPSFGGLALLGSAAEPCPLSSLSAGGNTYVKANDVFYRYDPRFMLRENDVSTPTGDSKACVTQNAINEQTCKVQAVPMNSRTEGLSLQVDDISNGKTREYMDQAGGTPIAHLVDKQVNHPPVYMWPGLPLGLWFFVARWTGDIDIAVGGDYTFFMQSDDGSRLYIDGQMVVQNDGSHGMLEKSGTVTLAAGRHPLLIDFFQAGGHVGIIMSYSGPDTQNTKQVVPSSVLSTFGRGELMFGCPVTCGSPFEVANKPELGHQYSIYLNLEWKSLDRNLDNRFDEVMSPRLSKSTVWTAKALTGADQLRQRMAWALAQTFVVSVQGRIVGEDYFSEMFVNYYDIFVRHAFGSYLDILKEVTLSPVMGRYLTSTMSASFDYDGKTPNENFARELFNLFTIGLRYLNKDGTTQLGPDGKAIATYTPETILSFSRVFTGFITQPQRANAEYYSDNLVDPMDIYVPMHDIYPKPDLMDNYVGDAYPLCIDKLHNHSFLAKGAQYRYRSQAQAQASTSDVLILGTGSALGQKLCGPDNVCGSLYSVLLDQDIQCSGDECSAHSVRVVVAGGFYYEYVPPPCVHLWVPIPPPNATLERVRAEHGRSCAIYANSTFGQAIKLDMNDVGDNVPRREQCLQACHDIRANGCALIHSQDNSGCFGILNQGVLFENGINDTVCWILDGRYREPKEMKGSCNVLGAPVWTTKISNISGRTWQRKQMCKKLCKDVGVLGCHMIHIPDEPENSGCFAALSEGEYVGTGEVNNSCWWFNETGQRGYSYRLHTKGAPVCPLDLGIQNMPECIEALRLMGSPHSRIAVVTDEADAQKHPMGCSYDNSGTMWWNWWQQGGGSDPNLWPVCRNWMDIDNRGRFIPNVVENSFRVHWNDTVAVEGRYKIDAKMQVVFSSVPTLAEAKDRLFIGAHAPHVACDVCSGDVKAYALADGKATGDTVFEIGGKYYRNWESYVVAPATNQTFRNPPHFVLRVTDDNARRAAFHEVFAALENIYHHPNTPVFACQRLLNRFGFSNPTTNQVSGCVDAFETGTFGGHTYSGKYGDLGAAAAAILLHQDARTPDSSTTTTVQGAIREPLLKIVHFLRSMEYTDVDQTNVVFRHLNDLIGQFPYNSPDVFNFYKYQYELPQKHLGPNAAPTLYSPELQLLTPPNLVSYLNGMASVIKFGVSDLCADTQGIGIHVHFTEGPDRKTLCPQGHLMYAGKATEEQTLEELNILLTGGRLSDSAKSIVKLAYDEAQAGHELKAAQFAAAMTAEFNTVGPPLATPATRQPIQNAVGSGGKPYKALVLIYLTGGADSWNLLVPQGCDLYQEYKDVRKDLALEPHDLLGVTTTGQVCSQYGIHNSLSFAKGLYDVGEAAWVTNIGNLPAPTTKDGFMSGTDMRCRNMFAHHDQQVGGQTLKCQELGTASMGVGGRMADKLAQGSQQFSTTSVSLAGSAVWSEGFNTHREVVDSRGSVTFSAYEEWRHAISNITAVRHGNVYAECYTDALLNHVELSQRMSRVFDNQALKTNYPISSNLDREFSQVAKLIGARVDRQVERDFFFLHLPGWDHHGNMKAEFAALLSTLNAALQGFVAELKADNVWSSVVVTMQSEFGRTLDSNGGGSDHGWAGQTFIMGGDIKGGRVFNTFPATFQANNDHDVGRGRLIPDYPWESMLKPIAEWLGLEAGDLAYVFPNIGNFDATTHFIPRADLFKS